eukprot:CAMPEP_0119277228 /NCGR_PEP_ID=MMETSP1329-20130426/16781_1 /TAXON_ID=114041 /ORGANISM="Genus nov. species nov., Strain RCC1024" /LENGTH=89 /DNA_ID=CAMNT_0007277691 /DNA_START=120 /DNA_END=386 /DNA_ORIENTATION=-
MADMPGVDDRHAAMGRRAASVVENEVLGDAAKPFYADPPPARQSYYVERDQRGPAHASFAQSPGAEPASFGLGASGSFNQSGKKKRPPA